MHAFCFQNLILLQNKNGCEDRTPKYIKIDAKNNEFVSIKEYIEEKTLYFSENCIEYIVFFVFLHEDNSKFKNKKLFSLHKKMHAKERNPRIFLCETYKGKRGVLSCVTKKKNARFFVEKSLQM